ncbi:MAG: hypothetical protein AB1610_11685 [Nitrospirota bacterium]
MAKGRKRKASADEDVEAYRHESEARKNVVPVGIASYDTLTSKPKKYEYDPHPLITRKTELMWEWEQNNNNCRERL